MDKNSKKPNSITITYLSKISFGSPNGADKEIDNINPIKKIKMNDGLEYPYISSQAVRRALRDKLEELGYKGEVDKIDTKAKNGKKEVSDKANDEAKDAVDEERDARSDKAPVKTAMDINKYIGDDLFGYLDAKSGKKRTSPLRVESLVSLHPFKEGLDYGTNFQGDKIGNRGANIFETEIHSGIYRGTILIELDRIGKEEEDEKEKKVDDKEKAKRVKTLLKSFQMLWIPGRQTRFLGDASPKFIAAALMTSKNPIFLEAVNLSENGNIDFDKVKSVKDDYADFIDESVYAVQEAIFDKPKEEDTIIVQSIKPAFKEIFGWVEKYYGVEKSNADT